MNEYLSKLDYDGFIENVGIASYWIPTLADKKITRPTVLINDNWVKPNPIEVDYLYISNKGPNSCSNLDKYRKNIIVSSGENFCFAKFV